MKVVCFHNPDEQNGYLSNWYHSEFMLDYIKFSSMEQYMMFRKAMLFKDKEIAEQILKTSDVRYIKELGRKVRNFDDNIWVQHREEIVYTGLYAKFSQNVKLKEKLLKTGDAILAECAVKDKIWGIGLSMTDERNQNPNEWRGLNLLGKNLMKVRQELRTWGNYNN